LTQKNKEFKEIELCLIEKDFKVLLLNINRFFGGFEMKQKQIKKGIISFLVEAFTVNLITLAEILFKPYYLLPVIGVIIISAVLMALAGGILERPVTDLVLYFDQIPQDNLLGMILFNYPIEFFSMLVLSFFMSVVSLMGMVSVSRMAKEEGIMDSINQTIKEWRKIVGVIAIVWVIAVLFFIAGTIITMLGAVNEIIMALLFVALGIIAGATLIKAVFIIPALAEETETKKAIALGFEFTNRIGIVRFISLLIFLVLAILVASIGWTLIYQVGIILGGIFEIPSMIIGEAFGTAFFVAAITNYFYKKEQK
jgi:hypothetical protein